MQIVPTLGSKVYKWYLLWAIWSVRVCIGFSVDGFGCRVFGVFFVEGRLGAWVPETPNPLGFRVF